MLHLLPRSWGHVQFRQNYIQWAERCGKEQPESRERVQWLSPTLFLWGNINSHLHVVTVVVIKLKTYTQRTALLGLLEPRPLGSLGLIEPSLVKVLWAWVCSELQHILKGYCNNILMASTFSKIRKMFYNGPKMRRIYLGLLTFNALVKLRSLGSKATAFLQAASFYPCHMAWSPHEENMTFKNNLKT